MFKWCGGLAVLAAFAGPATMMADQVTLVDNGQARVSVVVPAGVVHAADGAAPRPQPPRNESSDQALLRWAAEDLAEYLGRVSGATIQIGHEPVAGLIPIYVGQAPEQVDLGVSSEFGDAYLIDITPQRIVLIGESARSSYYAVARLLHQVGVRWYAPGQMGEYVPEARTISLASGRTASAPHYQTRNLWGRDRQEQRWLLRNRMGGPQMPQGHAFARFQQPIGGGDRRKFFEEHQDYFPVINGQVTMFQANLANPELIKHFAEHIRHNLRRGTRWAGGKGEGIGPDDGPIIDERPEAQAIVRGRRDPMLRVMDSTDLFVRYANALARELEEEFGDHRLGFYVYSNHAGVPTDEKPHRMLYPIITPITFSRFSSIGNPRVPTSMMLADITRRWAELSEDIGFYLYNFNLADTAMPFTRTLTWSKDIPQLYEWGLRYGSIESMTNWHTMVPGNYVLANLMWDVHADPLALAEEVYANYYGPAADAMREYNHLLEQAYENTDAHAGNIWAIHRILHPRLMSQLQATLRRAQGAVSGQEPYAARVEVHRYSLNFAERWFAARDALNSFRLREAADEAEAFLANYEEAHEKYPLYFASSIARYFESYHMNSFKDARRVASEGRLLYQFPDTLKAYLDEDQLGHRMGLGDPRSLASNWMDLKTYSATIDEQGFPHFRGLIWYRHEFNMPTLAAGPQTEGLFGTPTDDAPSRVKLWFAGTDAAVHVFVNGEDLGQHPSRRFGPVDVDITSSIRPGARNTIIVAVDNSGVVELGTGGIMRPAAIYQGR